MTDAVHPGIACALSRGALRGPHGPRAHPRLRVVMASFNTFAVALALAATDHRPACAADDPPPSGHDDLQLTYEWSRGHYGEPGQTRIDAWTFIARHRGDGWLAEVQIPLLQVRADGGRTALPDTVGSGRNAERGIGDAWLLVAKELRAVSDDATGIDLTAKVKTRTGSVDRGLGSGGVDVALQVDVVRPVGRSVVFGTLGYRRTGDVSGFPRYRDPWYAELGSYVRPQAPLEFGAYYDYRQAIGSLGPLREATAYAGWRGDALRTQLYVTRGFARASADWAVGLSARRRF